ncbi:MAG: sugar transferase [Clostridiales Family XIII bacterium]|jgi:exopolysaccharide biosynthesis polyprenyl glycosylphosphotransferase|nr:sugar transferase [Clostridiales Family XIII bacterium]
MNKHNSFATFDFGQLLLDVVSIGVAYFASAAIYFAVNGHNPIPHYYWMLLSFTVLFVLTMHFARMYNVTTFLYTDRVIVRVFGSAVLASTVIAALVFLMQFKATSRLVFLTFVGLSCAIVITNRLLGQKGSMRARKHHMLFVGSEEVFCTYLHYLSQGAFHYDTSQDVCISPDALAMRTPQFFDNYLRSSGFDEVVFVHDGRGAFEYETYMRICEEMGLTTRLILETVQLPQSKRFIQSVGTFPVLTYHRVSMDMPRILIKSIFDVCGACVALVITSPIFLAAAIAIKLDSPGPVFFRQKRVGKSGRTFEILKFRSMVTDAEALKHALMAKNEMGSDHMFKLENDPRVTRVGAFLRRTSIDELPQLINVLRREMSLVGTRPPTVDEVALYERRHRRRISIMPGITGLWQVSGRSSIRNFENVVELDETYIDSWSLGLDLKILWRTVGVLVNRRGAC